MIAPTGSEMRTTNVDTAGSPGTVHEACTRAHYNLPYMPYIMRVKIPVKIKKVPETAKGKLKAKGLDKFEN